MKKVTVLDLVLVICLTVGLLAFAGAVAAQEEVHWGYEGENGPEHWGEISPEYAACSEGREQAPIDIPAGTPTNAGDIVFNYQPTALDIVNNGHAIQVNYDEGSFMEVEGKKYNLLQFHFHALSEHTVGGKHYDMEGHLVHQSEDGESAVVGILMSRGAENAAFEPVWGHMPAEEGEPETIEGVTVNAIDLLPADKSYYRYDGSLTTPPCTEGFKWFELATPVELSEAQMSAFEVIYDYNYRPVQPFNDRVFHVGAVPQTLPVTGGEVFPLAGVLGGFGALAAGVGLYLRRREAA